MKKMKRHLLTGIFLLSIGSGLLAQNTGNLKSVIYDFDGLDLGGTDLPDGDYKNNDLRYYVAGNPLQSSEMLGDRVLELDLNRNVGSGEFGKQIGRFIELNVATDKLNFYFYNPMNNSGDAHVWVSISEDDNTDNVFENNADDRWTAALTVPRSADWQLISVPLSNFYDDNTGGNGIFDAGYSNFAGMIFSVSLNFKMNQNSNFEKYYIDMISFSEGSLPTGVSILDLPPKNGSGSCAIGALSGQFSADLTPGEIEGLFNYDKKIRYVNWFLAYSYSGTTPNIFPGTEVTNLLSQGYRPVITWEMMFRSYDRLDPVQPRLNKLLNGDYDAYIDQFADKIKSYNDTIILRIFHEFEGNWYPWSLSENNNDPTLYIAAYRHVVDRFRARGADKVQWMWCVNAEPKPYTAYNCIMNAYPGDTYVNIVATDVYNHPNLGTPPWKSFRSTIAESYFYLNHYFPNKPFYICEVACRERDNTEMATSQTKAEWTCQMSKDLTTLFGKTKALIFFSTIKEHDWRINSSASALAAARQCIWHTDFFADTISIRNPENTIVFKLFPNPFLNELNITAEGHALEGMSSQVTIYNTQGENVYAYRDLKAGEKIKVETNLAAGVYIVELKNNLYAKKFKVVKAGT